MPNWNAYVGATQVQKIYLGLQELTSAYLASVQLFLSPPTPAVVTLVSIDSNEPPATSQATTSATYTAGWHLIGVAQYNTNSVNPDVPTVSGMGVGSWTQVNDLLFADSGTGRRRLTVFAAEVPADGTGSATVAVTTAPATTNTVLLFADGAGGIGVNAVGPANEGYGNNVFEDVVTMPAPATVDSRFVAFAAANSAGAQRFELSTDSGGVVDWVTSGQIASSSPSTNTIGGWYDGDPNDDLTIGFLSPTSAGAAVGMIGVEVLPGSVVAAPPPPPPVVPYVMVGAATQQVGGKTIAQATSDFETLIGASLELGRRYSGGTETNFAAVASFAVDTNVRSRFVSMKGSVNSAPTQAQWESFITSIPADGFDTYVTAHHEPDNDGGSHDIAWFQGQLDRLHAAWVATGSRADVFPSFNPTGYEERDNNPSTTSQNWFPRTAIAADFVCWYDPYDPNAQKTLQQQIEVSVDLWLNYTNSSGLWGIAETGTKRTGADGANWITQSFAWARAKGGCVCIAWFNSSVGANGPWYLPSGLMATAYGDQVGMV